MSTWMNAADAVVVTSDYEGFGMAAIEALACDVPVLSTPVGVAPYLLAGIGAASAPPSTPRDGPPRPARTSPRRTPAWPDRRAPRPSPRGRWRSA